MKNLLVIPLMLLVAACATTQPLPPKVIDTACDWVPALDFSRKDTPDTKREIIEYEKARRANCPEGATQGEK